MEKIIIKNFAGLEKAEILLNSINLFIGKQASGKSVTAKLLYFFKGIFRDIYEGVQSDKRKADIDSTLLKKFEDYFPSESWPAKTFDLQYFIGADWVRITRKDKSKLKIEYSEKVYKQFSNARRIINTDKIKFEPKDKFEIYRPGFQLQEKYMSIILKEFGQTSCNNPIFIPAGRSFFANLQSSIFTFLSSNKAIDPFLVEFGSFYEGLKAFALRSSTIKDDKSLLSNADDLIYEILGSQYIREKNKDFLLHQDKRKINVSFASSGQQETLPLLVILKALLRINFIGNGATLFIEEPEAHLFPEAQKKIVELLGLLFNRSKTNLQFVITTHSPYILTSLNNLVQGSVINKTIKQSDQSKLYKIIKKDYLIDNKHINAYSFVNNTAESIIDDETGLVYSSYLDSVSENIAEDFDNLLNLV